MPTTAEIAKSIETRRQEIKGELAKLDAASKALANGHAPAVGTQQQTSPNTIVTKLDLSPQPKAKRVRRTSRGGRVTRKDQAAALLKEEPRTIPDLAAAMKIEPNYLYRVLPKVKGAKVDPKTKIWSIG